MNNNYAMHGFTHNPTCTRYIDYCMGRSVDTYLYLQTQIYNDCNVISCNVYKLQVYVYSSPKEEVKITPIGIPQHCITNIIDAINNASNKFLFYMYHMLDVKFKTQLYQTFMTCQIWGTQKNQTTDSDPTSKQAKHDC